MPNDLLPVVSNLHLRCAAAQRRLDVHTPVASFESNAVA